MTSRLFFLASIAIAAVALGTSSCSIPTEETEGGELPDYASFKDNGVAKFMEMRCGALDCHGQPGRPLRLYSEYGLRKGLNSDNTRPTTETTEDERLENYRSVVGLEPEAMAQCFATKGEEYNNFQLLLKPLGTENDGIRHKGGPVLRPVPTDPGWQCLYGWVSGEVNADECARAANLN